MDSKRTPPIVADATRHSAGGARGGDPEAGLDLPPAPRMAFYAPVASTCSVAWRDGWWESPGGDPDDSCARRAAQRHGTPIRSPRGCSIGFFVPSMEPQQRFGGDRDNQWTRGQQERRVAL